MTERLMIETCVGMESDSIAVAMDGFISSSSMYLVFISSFPRSFGLDLAALDTPRHQFTLYIHPSIETMLFDSLTLGPLTLHVARPLVGKYPGVGTLPGLVRGACCR
jgi:hypothetical protein